MSAVINVMKAELLKIVSKRRTYILAGLYWVLMPIVLLLVGRVVLINLGGSFLEGEGVPVDSLLGIIASPYGMARLAVLGPAYMNPSFYMIIVALFAALLIGEERSQNMWKTTLVAQPSRLAVYAGKFIVAWLVFAVLVAGGILFNALFGLLGMTFLPTGLGGDWLGLLGRAGLQLWFAGAAIAFGFLMVFLLRNVALGIVTIFFLPPLLEGLYTLYATVVGFQPLTRFNMVFQALNLQRTMEELPRYFFTTNLYAPARSLLAELSRGVDLGLNQSELSRLLGSDLTLGHSALVTAGYFVVFALIGYWLFHRRDVP